ncbi:MAG: anti-sigma factor antagonist [Phycisphaera sp.]|nr:MAG: anti-sigma factor antagonist [Phycisphaera sp.]
MADQADLEITWDTREGATILRPIGDVDLSRSPSLRNNIRKVFENPPEKVIVELSEVSYMDSSGVATLVEAMQLSRKSNAKLVLCSMTERVFSIFEIARLDQVFTIRPDVDAALAE